MRIGTHRGCGGSVIHSDEVHMWLNQGDCKKCGKEVIIDEEAAKAIYQRHDYYTALHTQATKPKAKSFADIELREQHRRQPQGRARRQDGERDVSPSERGQGRGDRGTLTEKQKCAVKGCRTRTTRESYPAHLMSKHPKVVLKILDITMDYFEDVEDAVNA